MPISVDKLEGLLKGAFPNAKINITDLVGDQDHYQVEILSELFNNQTKVKQHQMVYQAIGDVMGGELHAMSIKTGTLEN